MRGEKPEISHAVVAWASQTGKGLLFFNKKGETSKEAAWPCPRTLRRHGSQEGVST